MLTKEEREQREAATALHHKDMVERGTYPSCVNCEYFDKDKELCSTYKARPPAMVIATACPEWEMEIPF